MVVIPPEEDAYGEKKEELIKGVPLSKFEDKDLVQVGMQFQVEPQPAIATVIGLTNDTATLDFNHPLAGQELYFDVSIFDVRDATLEELANSQQVTSNSCSLPPESKAKVAVVANFLVIVFFINLPTTMRFLPLKSNDVVFSNIFNAHLRR